MYAFRLLFQGEFSTPTSTIFCLAMVLSSIKISLRTTTAENVLAASGGTMKWGPQLIAIHTSCPGPWIVVMKNPSQETFLARMVPTRSGEEEGVECKDWGLQNRVGERKRKVGIPGLLQLHEKRRKTRRGTEPL